MHKTASKIMSVKTETVVGIVLMLLLSMVSNVSFGIIQTSMENPTIFRMLAIERRAGDTSLKSAEYLVSTLLRYANWNNSTEFTNYIKLLSLYEPSEIFEECRHLYGGVSNKANMRSGIIDFLGAANPGELVILYYDGGGMPLELVLDEVVTAEELTFWLSSGGLPQANVVVILDTCRSGSWIDDGSGGVLGSGRIVLCSCRSSQHSYAHPVELWSYFTGYGSPKNTGIIGALLGGAKDTNQNRWIDVMECFQYAKTSTEEYTDQKMNPVAYNGLGFDPPFVKLPEANFTVTPEKPVSNQTILFNASTSKGIISEYTWDFGDDNETTVYVPIITHRYEQPGNYTVTLTISNSITNSTSKTLTVYYVTDLNQDGTVNIVDISIVASAYGANEGDERYNQIADMDDNRQINIIDVSIVAMDYGKTV